MMSTNAYRVRRQSLISIVVLALMLLAVLSACGAHRRQPCRPYFHAGRNIHNSQPDQ